MRICYLSVVTTIVCIFGHGAAQPTGYGHEAAQTTGWLHVEQVLSGNYDTYTTWPDHYIFTLSLEDSFELKRRHPENDYVSNNHYFVRNPEQALNRANHELHIKFLGRPWTDQHQEGLLCYSVVMGVENLSKFYEVLESAIEPYRMPTKAEE